MHSGQGNELLVIELGKLLEANNWCVGTAESCTGGMIAAAMTDVAGSSHWFDEGVVTYANASKQRLLHVSEAALEQHGAVSEAVVLAMAQGVLRNGNDVSVATSGIAGPGGGCVEKPVGTVWFAWGVGNKLEAEKAHFAGSRRDVREKATEYAISGLLRRLKQAI